MIDIRLISFSVSVIFVLSFVSSCQNGSEGGVPQANLVDSTVLANYLIELGSDKFLGRKPVSPGEEITINYLKDEFQKMGLQPGNGDSYFQEVPLVEITSSPAEKMLITGNGPALEFDFKEDFVTTTMQVKEEIEVKNSELVFCGFGIVAPEYNWNDYEGIDMRGKTAVVFVNDPGFYSEDSSFFKGSTMTYYGRWTYKYEEAARQGADGVLIVHEKAAAGYPWFVVQSSWTGGLQSLQTPDDNLSRCAVEGWLTLTAARELFQYSKIDAKNLLGLAQTPGFKPMPTGVYMNSSMTNTFKKESSYNVVALLEGQERSDEYIIYTAHWDHLGIGQPVQGDSIYNGALDNASGLATMMAIAKSFSQLEEPPSRSIVFLAVTAEEQGLLGSAWYAANPIFPLNKTIANLNKDGANVVGDMKDLTITGFGQSELDDLAAAEAKKQNRYILPEQEPEKGYFFRSDHFEFAKVGVPAFYGGGRSDHRAKGKEYAKSKTDEYTAQNYHRPSDEYSDDWDLTGAVQDAQLYFNMGLRLGNEAIYPEWKEGSEFRSKRGLVD